MRYSVNHSGDDVLSAGCGIMFILLLLTIGPVIWITRSYFEARAFNRVTGQNVSTFDAMFIELRVQENVKD